MKTPVGHRKSVRHYDDPRHVRELTFSCYERRPLLTSDAWRAMLGRAIDLAAQRHDWRLTAFVLMPDHVHLLVFPLPTAAKIEHLLKAIKRPCAYRIKQWLLQRRSRLLQRLTVRQRPGVQTFRFWQEGPGYDRNLTTPAAVQAAIDYIHLNPVRRGLCQTATQWRWSSARFYADPTAPPDEALPKLYPLPAAFFQ